MVMMMMIRRRRRRRRRMVQPLEKADQICCSDELVYQASRCADDECRVLITVTMNVRHMHCQRGTAVMSADLQTSAAVLAPE
jgi:hypothetical protein